VTLLEQWGVPLAVMGMVLATLLLAAILNRYQAHQAAVRVAVRRLDSGLSVISNALDALVRVPLSRELRVALRGEVLARCQKIRRLYRRYPAIMDKIRAAEDALSTEGPPRSDGVGVIESEQALRGTVAALDDLMAVIGHGDTLQPLPRDVRGIFQRELGERRAEAMARFHLVEARRQQGNGNVNPARKHLTTLMRVLRQRGPSTDFVRELYAEAEAAFACLTKPQRVAPEGDAAATGVPAQPRITA
jgi:hypothetical protein